MRFVALSLGLVGWALLGCALAVGCAADEPATLPADVLRLGNYRLATAEEANSGVISGQLAIASAAAFGYQQPGANAYLVVPVDPQASSLFPQLVRRNPMWIVRWTGIDDMGPLPAGSGGVLPSRVPFQFLYVTVDAISGEVVHATYME
jgi:hypothetical protein